VSFNRLTDTQNMSSTHNLASYIP